MATIMEGREVEPLIVGLSVINPGMAGAMGALSNAYCYMGITEKNLNIIIVNSFIPTKIENRFALPLNCITQVKVKGGILTGRMVVILKYGEGKMKLALMNNAIGSIIAGQKENVEILLHVLEKLLK